MPDSKMPQSRLTARWVSEGDLELGFQKIPALGDDEILLKVMACAVCGSDLRILRHGNPRVQPGTIIGHEISGEVVAVGGSVVEWSVGDRLSVGADVPCLECEHCSAGRPNCCDVNYAIGHQFEGGFSEYMVLNGLTLNRGPVRKLRASTSFKVAALAEPLACCINGFERCFVTSRRDDINNIVVFGAGPIGMMLSRLGSYFGGKRIILIDPNADRLTMAKDMCIGSDYIDAKVSDPVDEVLKLTSGEGANLVFTACPAPAAHEQAIQMIAKRGFINFFGGLPKNAGHISLLSNHIHYREAYITGSHGSTPEQHSKAVELIESGDILIEDLITHVFPLTDITLAYEKASSGEAVKVLVAPHSCN